MGIKIKIRKNKKAITFDEWEFSNQNWIKVLDTIWKRAPNRYGRGKTDYDENHRLVKRLKIKAHELMLIMSFLEDQGLIEYDKPDYNWINLTSKGFDVALQNQSANRTRSNNQAILFLSLVIAIAAISGVIIGIDNLIEKWVVTGLFSVVFIVGGYLIKRSF